MTTKVNDPMLLTPPSLHYYFASTPTPPTAGMVFAVPHGLIGIPTLLQAVLSCSITELGYSVGDQCLLSVGTAAGSGTLAVDATNIRVMIQGTPSIPNKTSGTPGAITLANWRVILRCWL